MMHVQKKEKPKVLIEEDTGFNDKDHEWSNNWNREMLLQGYRVKYVKTFK